MDIWLKARCKIDLNIFLVMTGPFTFIEQRQIMYKMYQNSIEMNENRKHLFSEHRNLSY